MNKPKLPNDVYWPDVIVVIGCLIAYAVVAVVTAVGNEKALEVERERAEAYRQVMLACLNNGGFAFKDTNRAYYCEAKEI